MYSLKNIICKLNTYIFLLVLFLGNEALAKELMPPKKACAGSEIYYYYHWINENKCNLIHQFKHAKENKDAKKLRRLFKKSFSHKPKITNSLDVCSDYLVLDYIHLFFNSLDYDSPCNTKTKKDTVNVVPSDKKVKNKKPILTLLIRIKKQNLIIRIHLLRV